MKNPRRMMAFVSYTALAIALSMPAQAQGTAAPPPIVATPAGPPAAAAKSPAQVVSPGWPMPPAPGTVTQGTVVQVLMNHHGEADGLLLDNGVQIHFPPHMSERLVAIGIPGQPVGAQGYTVAGGPMFRAYAITNLSNQKTIVQEEPSWFQRPPPHVRDQQLVLQQADGTIQHLLYGKRGEVNGVILNDRTIVRVPPHAYQQMGNLLQRGQAISAQGYGMSNAIGRVLKADAVGPASGALTPIYHGKDKSKKGKEKWK